MIENSLVEDMQNFLVRLEKENEISFEAGIGIMQIINQHRVKLCGAERVCDYELIKNPRFDEYIKNSLIEKTVMADDVLGKRVKIEKRDFSETQATVFRSELELYL